MEKILEKFGPKAVRQEKKEFEELFKKKQLEDEYSFSSVLNSRICPLCGAEIEVTTEQRYHPKIHREISVYILCCNNCGGIFDQDEDHIRV